MADRYIDTAYVRAEVGRDYELAISAFGVSLTGKIENATALVQGFMRNAGYTPPTTQDPTTVEALVKMAVLWSVMVSMAHTPEASVPLPVDSEENGFRDAYWGLKEGTLQLAATPTNISAVGGWKMSDHGETSATGLPPRTTRSQLRGF